MEENEKRRAGEVEVGATDSSYQGKVKTFYLYLLLFCTMGSILIESFHLFLALLKPKPNLNKIIFLVLKLIFIYFLI